VLLTAPDAPISLTNLPLVTSGSQIGISWQLGPMNGGAPVLDYQVLWNNATGTFSVLASNITTNTYTATGI
jgi:hypothetical protein